LEAVVKDRGPGSVVVLPDLETMSREAAGLFVQLSQASLASHDRFTAALSGGSTPRMFYALLGSDRYRAAVEWKKAHLFWADERIVPPDDPESNFRLAFETFISKVSLSPANIHRIKGEMDAGTAAREYEKEIQDVFGREGFPAFDLVVLGVGEDGHTASLFPGSSALEERKRFAVPVYLAKPKLDRVTLTLPVLNNALHVLVLASGRAKADVLQDILEQGNRKKYPAGLVEPVHGNIRWLIDREAAAKLRTT
jgi:6-phosphogluconolactonase